MLSLGEHEKSFITSGPAVLKCSELEPVYLCINSMWIALLYMDFC